MIKILSIFLMAFMLSGFAVAVPYSPAQGEVLDANAIGSGLGDMSPGLDVLSPAPPAPPETRQLPTAEWQYLIASTDASAIAHFEYTVEAKSEVGWRLAASN